MMYTELLGSRIRSLRDDWGYTQKQFANMIHVKPASLSSYENNENKPPISVLMEIAITFDVSIDWLCGLTNNRSMNGLLNTYSDVIDALERIDFAIGLDIKTNLDKIKVKNAGGEIEELEAVEIYLQLSKNYMDKFLVEWRNMKELRKSQLMNDDLYDLWLENQIKEYEKKEIGSSD